MSQPSFESKSKYDKRVWAELREAVIKKFGASCNRCGLSDKRALQIDHVKGNGARDRERFPHVKAYYRYLVSDGTKEDYQVLCANCNMIKKFENYEFRGRKNI